jgi:hypothetical protein
VHLGVQIYRLTVFIWRTNAGQKRERRDRNREEERDGAFDEIGQRLILSQNKLIVYRIAESKQWIISICIGY